MGIGDIEFQVTFYKIYWTALKTTDFKFSYWKEELFIINLDLTKLFNSVLQKSHKINLNGVSLCGFRADCSIYIVRINTKAYIRGRYLLALQWKLMASLRGCFNKNIKLCFTKQKSSLMLWNMMKKCYFLGIQKSKYNKIWVLTSKTRKKKEL